jgi:hypothetical protein
MSSWLDLQALEPYAYGRLDLQALESHAYGRLDLQALESHAYGRLDPHVDPHVLDARA